MTIKLYQTGSLISLLSGVYDGDCRIEKLKQFGNLGLGTPNRVAGEIIIDQGKFYCADETGLVRELQDDEITPFSVVVDFKPQLQFTLDPVASFTELETIIDQHLPSLNHIYALRLQGEFAYIKARSECAQTKPYQPLSNTLPQLQKIFEWHNITGNMVGFRFPSYLAAVNVEGYHFHFIDVDHKLGGHVFNFNLNQPLHVEICQATRLIMDVPENDLFNHTELVNNDPQSVADLEKQR